MKATLTLLKGILTKMGASLKDIPADAPADIKTFLTGQREQITTLLGKIPGVDTEADAAALESKIMIVLNGMNDVAADAVAQAAKLPLLIKQGVEDAIKDKIAKAELLTPEKAQSLVAEARADEKKIVEAATKERLTVLAGRRTELAAAGLPEAMPEGVLGGKPEEFNAAKAKAVTRKTELTEKKLLSLLGSTEQSDLLYAADDIYTKHRDTLLKVLNGGKPAPNPMQGGGGGGKDETTLVGAV